MAAVAATALLRLRVVERLRLLGVGLARRSGIFGRPPEATTGLRRASIMPSAASVRPMTVPPATPSAPAGEGSRIGEVSRRIVDGDTTSLDAKDLVERIRARRRELENLDAAADAGAEAEPVRDRTVATEAEDAPPSAAAESEAGAEVAGGTAPTPDDTPPPAAEAPASRPRKAKRPAPRRAGDYALPAFDILDQPPVRREQEANAEIDDTSRLIEALFAEHDIKVKVVRATRGPVITQYELELLETGMRVNRLEGYEKDLALKLGTEGIRIVAPLPNRKTIGVEVPNRLKEVVVMRDLVEEIDPQALALPIIIGRDVLGRPMVGDLARMPHLLIAGATGMGKSVCLNAIITTVLLFRGPEEVRFIMVDPKQVELSGYEGIPHLLAAPITDMTKAHAALEWACATMDERFYALRLVGARDIQTYNGLGREEIERRLSAKGKSLDDLPGAGEKMPYYVIVVDEYADLMMVNKEVEKSLVRLTAKARACGIHVILTTQRPSADVVTGLIKSNLPCRICFRVADKSNSRVVLDQGGAENLLGRGDMLFLPPGSSSLVRGQGVWVKDREQESIIAHARSQGTPEYDEGIFRIGAVAMEGGGDSGDVDGSDWLSDRTFHEAVWAMYKYNKTGADFLRRKMNVGYNKATGYIEKLEDLGIVGPQKGTRPREFLKPFDEWINLLRDNGLSWEDDDEIYRNPLADA